MITKVLRKFFLALFILLVAVPVVIIGILFVDVVRINSTPITDEEAFHLIERYFGYDMAASSTVCYRDYGTNVREEFFTIVVDCEDEAILESILKTACDYYPVDAFGESFPSFSSFQSVIPDAVQGFYVYSESLKHKENYMFVAVSDDNSRIVFEFDP